MKCVSVGDSVMVHGKWAQSGAAVAGAKVAAGKEHSIYRWEVPVQWYVDFSQPFTVQAYKRLERCVSPPFLLCFGSNVVLFLFSIDC